MHAQNPQKYQLDTDFWLSFTDGVELQGCLAVRRKIGEANWQTEHRMWPVPKDALYLNSPDVTEQTVHRLEPHKPTHPTIGLDDDPAREALYRPLPPPQGKPDTPPQWWTETDFIDWLCAKSVVAHSRADRAKLSLSVRSDIHVSIEPETYTARESFLYAKEIVENIQRNTGFDGEIAVDFYEWAIGLSLELPSLPEHFPPNILKLGGKQYLTFAKDLKPTNGSQSLPDLFAFPDALKDAVDNRPSDRPLRGIRLLVITPAHFGKNAWLPEGFANHNDQYIGKLCKTHDNQPSQVILPDKLVLRAAFVPRPAHVSGWDYANKCPKPTRRLVAPGSVYFFEKSDGSAFTISDLQSLWLASIGCNTKDGYGLVVPGIWEPPS
jgi:CRISPR-associated protein Cmr3